MAVGDHTFPMGKQSCPQFIYLCQRKYGPGIERRDPHSWVRRQWTVFQSIRLQSDQPQMLRYPSK
jgi:hypothetical protein